MGKYLGIDYGNRRIGLALADSETKLAHAHGAVAPSDLPAAIKQLGPFDAVVVGLPRNLDGAETAQSAAVRRFADDVLWRKLKIDPIFQDEAATSVLAEERLRESGKPYEKGDIDAEAAAIFLQDYLDSL